MSSTSSPTHFGWLSHPAPGRRLAAVAIAIAGGAAAVVAVASVGGGAACATAGGTAGAPDLRVTALPGVDLAPAAGLPGVSASSGPFPAIATSIRRKGVERAARIEARPPGRALLGPGGPARRGDVVVGRGLARALALEPGSAVTVAASPRPRRMRVSAVAPADGAGRVAYVAPADLARLSPNARVRGSTLLLRLADPSRSAALGAWLRRAYPGPQVAVARTPRGGCSPAESL